MSLHISALSRSGNFFVASDTQMVQEKAPGMFDIIRNDVHKTLQLDKKTFVFMSGLYDAAMLAIEAYMSACTGNLETDRRILSNILRSLYEQVPNTDRNTGEVAVLYFMRLTDEGIIGELYLHEGRNYEPVIQVVAPGSVTILGHHVEGTEPYIRERIQAAKTDHEMTVVIKEAYDMQRLPGVGGTLELFEISPANGLVNKRNYKIVEELR